MLLDAATEVFAREGYAAASVNRIAEAAGATKPTLYARFGAKSELFEAAVRDQADALLPRLFAAYDRATELPLREAIREGVDAWFAFAQERPAGMTLLFGEDLGAQSPVVGETTEAIVARIATVVEHYTAQADAPAGRAAPVIAAMIVGTAVYSIRRCLADPSLDAGDVSRLTTSLLVGAMQGLDPGLVRAVADSHA